MNLGPQLKQLLTDKVTNILAGTKKIKKQIPKRKKVSVAKRPKSPGLHGLLPANSQLKAIYKGKEYTAQVDDQGRIIIDGLTFNSPSPAATHVTKGPKDGWIFWKCQAPDGKWELLDQLRKHA